MRVRVRVRVSPRDGVVPHLREPGEVERGEAGAARDRGLETDVVHLQPRHVELTPTPTPTQALS